MISGITSVDKMLCSVSQIFDVQGIKQEPSKWARKEGSSEDGKTSFIPFIAMFNTKCWPPFREAAMTEDRGSIWQLAA